MKNFAIKIVAISLVTIWLSSLASAEMVTKKEALTVAKNWISLIIQQNGDWGGSKTAEVQDIQEFKRGKRILGYLVRVKPDGFIVVSLRQELAPVKAYSTVGNLDPESDKGLSDLIKGGMERVLNNLEKQVGPAESARSADIEKILEINYRHAWDELESYSVIGSGQVMTNYRRGEVMLSSNWEQGDPYNQQTPVITGDEACAHALVGCVATAGAQLMRYWAWPPYGVGFSFGDSYDWRNMPDIVTASSPQVEIDAVAELSHEVGEAADLDYGCTETSGDLACWWWGCRSLEDAFKENFRYSTAIDRQDRDDYGAVEWFERLKGEFNKNQPLPYRIPDHVVVADGWQEIGSTPIRQYHINYGWGDSTTTWYTLDEIYGGDPDDEFVLVNVFPAHATGSVLSGTYPLTSSFPYRYFNVDATGSSATFEAGQYLQFLPRITVTSTSTTGDNIRFYGTSSANTRLFTRGDISKGIRIYSGAIKLSSYGSITFS
jgi:hypothetical protein